MKLTTLGLSGPQWIKRLEKKGYKISDYAKYIILSVDFKKARLKKGIEVNVNFVTVRDLGKERATTQEIKDYARTQGYEIPTPEIALLLREAVSDEDIEALGGWYVAALHEPIKDSDGDPNVLFADRDGEGRWVNAGWDRPDGDWDAGGAFAFVVPASTSGISPSPSEPLSLELRIEKIEAVLKHHNLTLP